MQSREKFLISLIEAGKAVEVTVGSRYYPENW